MRITAGVPDWAADLRFAKNADRVRQRATLVPKVERVMATRSQRDWLAALLAAGVPSGPINKLDAVFADPQVVARNMRVDLPHPLAGQVPLVGPPLRMSGTPLVTDRSPPLLAAVPESVLRERLGLPAATVARLAAAGIIGLPR